jgi:ferritin
MNPAIEKAINGQINAEFYSAYLYLSMAAYFDSQNLSGFANWMKVQAQEEQTHAMKFYDFVFSRGGKVELFQIDKPESDFKSPLDVAEKTLAHEKKVTSLINGLYELALAEKDYPFQSLLKWYIDEQVEEEENATKLVDMIKLVGDKGPNIIMLDKELAGRKFKN